MKSTQEILMEAEVISLVIHLIYTGQYEIKDLQMNEKMAYVEVKAQQIIKMVRETQ